MSGQPAISEAFWPLLDAACDGTLSEMQAQELAALLSNDSAVRKVFIDHMHLRRHIRSVCRVERTCDGGLARVQAILPRVSRPASPVFGFISTTLHTTLGYFSEGMPLAYLLATLIFGVGLLVGSRIHVSGPEQITQQSAPLPFPLSPLPSSSPFVGRITGMVDCQWTDRLPSPVCGRGVGGEGRWQLQSLVHLHDCFALASGLMEITYDTGAKVLLQGPVTYEVESAAGGYLSVGKLTARVEKKADSPLSPLLSPLFSVRTPTAVVTDLGTEFGVEVDKQGATTSHVFRGLVEVQVVGDGGKPEGTGQVLRENESVRVDGGQGERKIVVVSDLKSDRFARDIPKRTMKVFDLVDVVAGGDGFSGLRGRGIDPATGLPTDSTLAEPKNADTQDLARFRIVSDGEYHRAATFPFVDGVFIPGGRPGGVQIDSAGHVFSEFRPSCNTTAGNIWAGGIIPVLSTSMPPEIASLLPSWPPSQTLVPTRLGAIDYASKSHALILLPANNGITFDLDAIRRANPGFKPVRFVTTAGNTEIASEDGLAVVYADLWVLVDGRVRFRRREINKCSGVFQIAFAIAKEDRFLTLVATDGGNDIGFDWILFGDPVLEMLPAAPARPTSPQPK